MSKGTWQSPVGALDIAVKQLQPGASEVANIEFLQEAAINGQFRHPNVVQLMGVVTDEGPVSKKMFVILFLPQSMIRLVQTLIVLELLSNGDLLNFLINQRPRYHFPSEDKENSAVYSYRTLLYYYSPSEAAPVGTQ